MIHLTQAFENELDVHYQLNQQLMLARGAVHYAEDEHRRELERIEGEHQLELARARSQRAVESAVAEIEQARATAAAASPSPAEIARAPGASQNPRYLGHTDECFLCRKVLGDGQALFFATIGVDDAPSVIGQAESGPLVEDRSEFGVCGQCQPVLHRHFERLCRELWGMRAPDGAREEPAAPEGASS